MAMNSGYCSYTVYEDKAKGSVIATLTASDQDEGVNQRLSYFIVSTGLSAHFPININSSSGVLTTNASLDRETRARSVMTSLAASLAASHSLSHSLSHRLHLQSLGRLSSV